MYDMSFGSIADHEDVPHGLHLVQVRIDPEVFVLHLYRDRNIAGKLYYSTCDLCRLGKIWKISLYGSRRSGLGRFLVKGLRCQHPGLTWCTSPHTSTEAELFWAAMSAEHSDPYSAGVRYCNHPISGEPWTGRIDFPG